jgi:microcystin degradation protein MlrC
MPKILVAECKQEVASFNPVPSHYEDFSVSHGQDVLAYHRGGVLEMAGALQVFDERPDVELYPTYSARARTSAGTLAAADWNRIADEFLSAIRAAPPMDAIYFSLHGAMSAENEDDPEGYLLEETRRILGDATPIVISLDLHAVLTDRMVQHCNAFTVFHTYPHQDFAQTGARAARVLLRILDGEARPVIAKVDIPALVRGDELKTETGLLGGLIRRAQAIEASPGGLSAGMVIGNPFTDVPALGSFSFVITNNDPVRAEREALALAQSFWEVRDQLRAHLTPVHEAIRIASETEGSVIFTDAADAPSSGAPGDSNAILCALLEANYQGRALLPIVDPCAVTTARVAGVGSTITVMLGGALDPRFEPVAVQARVRMLGDGRFPYEYSGALTDAGNTAVLEAGSITIIVTSRSISLMDRSLFLAHGQDPQRYDLVVVKSPHTRHDYFEAWSAKNIGIDVPGATSADLKSLGHTKVRRPIYPLDPGVSFTPRAKLFGL